MCKCSFCFYTLFTRPCHYFLVWRIHCRVLVFILVVHDWSYFGQRKSTDLILEGLDCQVDT